MNSTKIVLGLLLLALARSATAGDEGPVAPRAVLTGRVLDHDGNPLAGADVAVFPSWKQARRDPQDLSLAAFTFAGLNDRSRFCNTAGGKESRLAHRSTSVDDLAVVTEGGHAQRLSPPKIGSPRASRKESFGSEAPELRDRPAASPPGVASAAPGGHEGA